MRMIRRTVLGVLLAGGAALVLVAIAGLRAKPAPRRSGAWRPRTEERDEPGGVKHDEAEGAIFGTVTAPEGVDVTEVRLSVFTKLGVFRSSNTGVSPFISSLKVGKGGTFRGDGLPLGEYRLLAEHPLCASYRTRFELQPGHGTGPLEVVLGRPGGLVIRALDAGGRGLAGENFVLHRAGGPFHHGYRLEPASPQIAAGLTDRNGEVRFASLQPGAYTLTRRGAVIEQREVTVRAGDETVVLFDASASLFGRLLGQDGQPISGAKLLLRASGGRIYETLTDKDGAWVIHDIATGEYRITVYVKDLGTAAIALPETVVIERGQPQERDLRLPAICLTGLVVHAESGTPFTSREVSVSASAISDKDGSLSHEVFAHATPDGRFEFRGLYPWRYQIFAHPSKIDDEYSEYASEVVTVTPTPAVQEVVIGIARIAKTSRLCLRVRDQQGNPSSDLCFTIDGISRVTYAKGVMRNLDATVVQPGVYEIRLVPGTHVIRISTQPMQTEKGLQSCYWDEVTVDVANGQTIEKDIALEKLLEY